MVAQPRPRPRGAMMASPQTFARTARLHRARVGAIAFNENVAGRFLELPQVGYQYRTLSWMDLTTTVVAAPTATWRAGYIPITNAVATYADAPGRFPAPLGILRDLRYGLNVTNPIWATDGYGCFLMHLISHRGAPPMLFDVPAANRGGFRKRANMFALYNETDADIVAPGTALEANDTFRLRAMFPINLTLGEFATAGLLPVQDIRIQPQLQVTWGNRDDLAVVAASGAAGGADLSTPTGNLDVQVDWFTTPSLGIRPDQTWILQTRYDQYPLQGATRYPFRPQIGGIILKYAMSLWTPRNGNGGVDGAELLALDPTQISSVDLIIQQSETLEIRRAETFSHDGLRWYSKELPDEAYVFDHTTAFGDPTLPSLRDRIPTNQLTRVEYGVTIQASPLAYIGGSGNPFTGGEARNYWQQLLPLPRLM